MILTTYFWEEHLVGGGVRILGSYLFNLGSNLGLDPV